eukprot:336103-Amphidinium_carterae.1
MFGISLLKSPAAAESKIQVTPPSLARASRQGKAQLESDKALWTTSCLPSPVPTSKTWLAACTTGREKLMRSGGGFGESQMGSTHR